MSIPVGWWTVKLYEDGVAKRTKHVYVGKMVWTTDSTYNNLVTSFNQGETIYFKAIGLKPNRYYRFMFKTPSGNKIYVDDWTTGVETLTGSYTLPSDAETGSWKLHVREASDACGTCEYHYVDTCHFEVTVAPPPPKYYLTVKTDPEGIVTIPGEGWYNASTYVNLTAPDLVAGPANNIRYRFDYWDVDGVSQGAGVNPMMVTMDAPHVATAHYTAITSQYTLTIVTTTGGTTDPPPGSYTYDEGTIVSVTAIPEENYKFDHWELNGTFYSDQSTVEVTMDNNYELKAFFEYLPSLSVSISPPSATINLGESVTFSTLPPEGRPPYSYQWYLNGNPIPGANSSTWTFRGTESGIYYICVVVTDSVHNEAQSSAAKVTVRTPTVGGLSFQ